MGCRVAVIPSMFLVITQRLFPADRLKVVAIQLPPRALLFDALYEFLGAVRMGQVRIGLLDGDLPIRRRLHRDHARAERQELPGHRVGEIFRELRQHEVAKVQNVLLQDRTNLCREPLGVVQVNCPIPGTVRGLSC